MKIPAFPTSRLTTSLRGALFASSLALGAGAACASPLSYDEAINGDLPETSPWVQLMLDAGQNTVRGSAFFSTIGGLTYDFDSFRFVVPANMKLVGISFSTRVSNTVGAPTVMRIDTYLDSYNPTTLLANELIDLLPTSSAADGAFSSAMPLGAGEYLLFQGQYQISAGGGKRVDWDYQWNLDVVEVPEPTSLALAGLALALTGALRRRKPGVKHDVGGPTC